MVYYGMVKHEKLLSKWWQTPSAQAAMERARNQRQAKHRAWIAQLKAYKAKRQQEVNQWKVKD